MHEAKFYLYLNLNLFEPTSNSFLGIYETW